ncbi:ABC transporter permease subunit [Sphaerisporangium sp. NPDC088356]|uniref:carbohydrate ABC transporter permease n=1 Tax=Sphaerisporangium sp. NPDC088356 TaxID=3154871 RepID=UPI00343BC47B
MRGSTLLLLAGMSKIDPALYEAARLDGAGPWREFISITVPSLRQGIALCVSVTVIAALASFDIIYISTQGGPGDMTMVPGPQIFYLAGIDQSSVQARGGAVGDGAVRQVAWMGRAIGRIDSTSLLGVLGW